MDSLWAEWIVGCDEVRFIQPIDGNPTYTAASRGGWKGEIFSIHLSGRPRAGSFDQGRFPIPVLYQSVNVPLTLSREMASYTDWKGWNDLYPTSLVDYSYTTIADPDMKTAVRALISDIILQKKARLMYVLSYRGEGEVR
jgi:hypothetical protein